MKIVQLEDAPLVRGLEHRGGTFHSRTTAEGTPGTPGNFKFALSKLGPDYSGPRLRHNFDQYRYMIEGESDYGQDGPLKAGMLGYYPEGVPYGPQVNTTEIYCAVLQFGGASGSGYLLPREVKAGMEELKAFGTFKDGIFHRNAGVPGRRNSDAYQAIWEHMHGHEMVYPKGRYDAPIYADAKNFEWAPVHGAPGVSRNCLVCGPSDAPRPACCGLRRARGMTSEGAAFIWCSRGQGSVTESRFGNTRPCFWIRVSERCSRRARRRSSCTMVCPIYPIWRQSAIRQASPCRRRNSRRGPSKSQTARSTRQC